MPETRKLILKIEVDLPGETISNLIDAAGYGMIDWCRKAHDDQVAETYTVWPHASVVDNDQIKGKHVITYDQIRDAIVSLHDGNHLPDWFIREIREDDIAGDSEVGAMIVQQAAFGEVVFG